MSYDIHIRIDVDLERFGRVYHECRTEVYSDSHNRAIEIVKSSTDEIIKVIKARVDEK